MLQRSPTEQSGGPWVWSPSGQGRGAYFLSWAGPGASGKEATVGSRDQSPCPSLGPTEDHFPEGLPSTYSPVLGAGGTFGDGASEPLPTHL